MEGFAVDWLDDNWYFADPVLKHVSVCGSRISTCAVVAGGQNAEFPLAGPRTIVLDPSEGLVEIFPHQVFFYFYF